MSIISRYFSDFNKGSNTHDYKKAMMIVFEDKENYGKLSVSVCTKMEMVKAGVEMLEQYSKEVKKRLNITQKDFDDFYGNADNDSINIKVSKDI